MTAKVAVVLIGLVWISLTLVCWGLLHFYQRRFIVSRYEEVGITKTKYFQHNVFRVLSHASWKPWFYTMHLFLVTVVPERLLLRRPGFRDLTTKGEILRHFSRRELATTVTVVSGFLMSIVLCAVVLMIDRVRS